MIPTDVVYISLIERIYENGETVQTRNGPTRRLFTLPTVTFESTPLVTVRKTAWQKALREWEWFMSGDPKCPDELLDWWDEQLNPHGLYLDGYGDQFRAFHFDQINNLIHSLRTNPFSREHVITAWNPVKMFLIKKTNDNPKTPACCHSTIIQFFCSPGGGLSMHCYQRSADMLLGVPHNWIQSWAFLQWIAEQTNRFAEKMLYTFGDAHIYCDPTHIQVVEQLMSMPLLTPQELRMSRLDPTIPRLVYTVCGDKNFCAADFEMIGTIPDPITTIRPVLL